LKEGFIILVKKNQTSKKKTKTKQNKEKALICSEKKNKLECF